MSVNAVVDGRDRKDEITISRFGAVLTLGPALVMEAESPASYPAVISRQGGPEAGGNSFAFLAALGHDYPLCLPLKIQNLFM